MAKWVAAVQSSVGGLTEKFKIPPEQKLWRAVLNQALEDAFNLNNTYLCDFEKMQARHFFEHRTPHYNSLCENAGFDPDTIWRKVKKLRDIKEGKCLPGNKTEENAFNYINSLLKKRFRMSGIHWRNK